MFARDRLKYLRLSLFTLVTGFSVYACNSENIEESKLAIAKSETSIRQAPTTLSRSTVLLDLDFDYCSGVIVADDKILTAAHCFDFVSRPSDIIVRFGADLRNLRYGRIGKAFRVHDQLDLAVLEIDNLPPGYFPVGIAEPSTRLFARDEVLIAGYGETASSRDDFGQFLRWGKTNFKAFYDEAVFGDSRTYRSILGFQGDGSDAAACSGDSGGPVLADVNGEWQLTGIISGYTGPNCERASESLAADPRPNKDWVLQAFPRSEAPVCDLSAPVSANEVIDLRFNSNASDIHSLIFDRKIMSLRSIQRPGYERLYTRQIAYVPTANTSCHSQPQNCLAQDEPVKITASSTDITLESMGFDLKGSEVFSAPDEDARPAGWIAQGTKVRVIERLPSGWLKVDWVGSLDPEQCS